MSRYFNKRNIKGQSITEIGILGAILVLLAGALINYAVKNDAQQRVMQMTFRKAMSSASRSSLDGYPVSASHMVIRDIYTPEPGHIFGKGPAVPISSSSSVTWNYRLSDVPETDSELPVMNIDIKGTKSGSYSVSLTTAGFSEAGNVDEDDLTNIKKLFGGVAGWGKGQWLDINDDKVEKCCQARTIMGVCSHYYYTRIRVVNYCAGQVKDYAYCVQQCEDLQNYGLTQYFSCNVPASEEPVIDYDIQKDIFEENVLTTTPSGVSSERLNWYERTTRTITPTGDTAVTEVGERK